MNKYVLSRYQLPSAVDNVPVTSTFSIYSGSRFEEWRAQLQEGTAAGAPAAIRKQLDAGAQLSPPPYPVHGMMQPTFRVRLPLSAGIPRGVSMVIPNPHKSTRKINYRDS